MSENFEFLKTIYFISSIPFNEYISEKFDSILTEILRE